MTPNLRKKRLNMAQSCRRLILGPPCQVVVSAVCWSCIGGISEAMRGLLVSGQPPGEFQKPKLRETLGGWQR
jgi:hypothetical protein